MEILENFLQFDEVYQKDMQDAQKIRKMYEELDLTREQINVIEDYVACLETALDRKCEIAFKLGKCIGELTL
ncbi:MAG: hypothetical protein IJ408_05270 [Clostridia bacterium]|nr:hypothetical protein [Clostridia bacterium]